MFPVGHTFPKLPNMGFLYLAFKAVGKSSR